MAAPTKKQPAAVGITSAEEFVKRLEAHRSATELQKLKRYFKTEAGDYGEGDAFMGVRMGQVFALAKESLAMPPQELEALLESPIHEVRAGALSIMGKQVSHKRTDPALRKELYELCLRRTDRVNNWDLVDLGGLYVIGPHLVDAPRGVLDKLARSRNIWERRLAIVSTGPLIRHGEVDDTYRIATKLLKDPEDLIHKATGWMLRAAGDEDRARLLRFLDKHAAAMPRTLLRYSIEKLDKPTRERYMDKKPAKAATKVKRR